MPLRFTGIDLFRHIGNEFRAVRSQHRHGIAFAVGIIHFARTHGKQTLHFAFDGGVGILGFETAVVLDGNQLMHRAGQRRVNLINSVLKFVKGKIHIVTRRREIGADHGCLLCRVTRNADNVFLILHRFLEQPVGSAFGHRHDGGNRLLDLVELPFTQCQFMVTLLHRIEPELQLIPLRGSGIDFVLQRIISDFRGRQTGLQFCHLARNGRNRFRQCRSVAGHGGALVFQRTLGKFPIAAFLPQFLHLAAQFLVFIHRVIDLIDELLKFRVNGASVVTDKPSAEP